MGTQCLLRGYQEVPFQGHSRGEVGFGSRDDEGILRCRVLYGSGVEMDDVLAF